MKDETLKEDRTIERERMYEDNLKIIKILK